VKNNFLDENHKKQRLVVNEDGTLTKSEYIKSEKRKTVSVFKTLGLLGNTGISISVPLIMGALIGRFLDDRFLTGSVLTLGFIVFGFILSILFLVRIFISFYKNTK